MTEDEVLSTLDEVGAVITDSHIVYASGRHGSAYVNKDAIYPHVDFVAEFCRAIAEHFCAEDIDVVASPAVGRVALAQHTALQLLEITGDLVFAVYAEKEKDGKTFSFRRGYDDYIPGKRVLVVEDVLTTGGSAKSVIEAVRALEGEVVGLGAICNRGGVKPRDVGDVPELFALCNIQLDSWPEDECPLCREGVPINTEVGKGREFLAQKGR